METYKAALKIKAFLLQKLESFFNEYIERYSKNIGYLQFYPLILIEDLYLANEHNPEKVSDKMYELSWFIASIRKRIKTSQLEHDIFVFNINDYNKFQKEYSCLLQNKSADLCKEFVQSPALFLCIKKDLPATPSPSTV